MSHLVTLKTQVTNLDALEKACEKLDLKLNRGQTQFKTWGTRARCEHAISMPNQTSNDYEIGLVKEAEAEAYTFKFDFFGQSNRLEQRAGAGCDLLTQRYAVEVARAQAETQGFEVFETLEQDQSITLQVAVGVGG